MQKQGVRKRKTHLASSMRLPDLGSAFLRTTGVVVHTTPVALQRGQLPGGGTGSHLRRRILQQSHAGRRLRLFPGPEPLSDNATDPSRKVGGAMIAQQCKGGSTGADIRVVRGGVGVEPSV